MKLTYEQIREITGGVSYIEEINGRVLFHRFTKEQERAYFYRSSDFSKKTFASAGVFLEFRTDSENLFLAAHLNSASSRGFYGCDVLVDGKLTACEKGAFPEGSAECDLELSASLGKGEKRVTVRLPWSAQTALESLELDDWASIKPVKREKNIIMFGDSITQGYDSQNPSMSYASRLCDALSFNAVIKAIGGEMFWPELAGMKDDIMPDLITVAYGTNDWTLIGKVEFEANCRAFYERLSLNYPDVNIYAITPIWRADHNMDAQKEYPFKYVAEFINRVAKGLDNITVIDGYDFIPKDTALFSDGYLHPNDDGFAYHADSIIKRLSESGVK